MNTLQVCKTCRPRNLGDSRSSVRPVFWAREKVKRKRYRGWNCETISNARWEDGRGETEVKRKEEEMWQENVEREGGKWTLTSSFLEFLYFVFWILNMIDYSMVSSTRLV